MSTTPRADGLFLGRDEGGDDLRLDAERLRTHGVVVGMTGSGKTGLCVVMLEELVAAGVPVIAIDPKGDLGNLALLFPQLTGDNFAPWVEAGGDAAATAATWKKGLQGYGIDEARVAALRDRLHLQLYTPGSEAGQLVDILGAFRRPAGIDRAEPDVLRGLVASTVSGLLALVGHGGDPVRDPAHVVLSTILEQAWTSGEDPDLETLILRLVDPPFDKVGVFPLDRFFSPDDRMDLAMALNAVVASPSFEAWTRGAPLDITALLGGPDGLPAALGGKVPVHVFSLAHLPDDQRQLFLSMLLGRLQAWSRGMPGTSRLRAVLFFDEVAGYLPPHPRNPPTKGPLLTMMKQARAVGLGVLLATQNPVDVDYKALSNAGLWFVGRLQTPQDRKRVLDGLGQGGLDDTVAGLDKRQFLLVDAKEDRPRVFGTRWAMSYLRGPFTRVEIARVCAALPVAAAAGASAAGAAAAPAAAASASAAPAAVAPAAVAPAADDGSLAAPPPVPGDCWTLDPRVAFANRLEGRFAEHAGPPRADGRVLYRPALFADLSLTFDERNGFTLDHHELRFWYPLDHDALPEPFRVQLDPEDLRPGPPEQARFAPLPAWLDEAAELKALQKRIADDVYRTETRGQQVHPKLKLYARGDESAEDFAARVAAAVEERVDAATAKLQDKYEKAGDRLEDRIRKLEAKIVEQRGVVRSRQAEEAVNVGETLLSWFSGRKKSVSTAVSKRRQSATAQQRLETSEQQLTDLQQEVYELERELEEEVAEIREREEKLLDEIEEKEVRLERNDVQLSRFGIVWVPATRRV